MPGIGGKKSTLNPGDPVFNGSPGPDSFIAPAGNSGINGGPGDDTVTFSFNLVDAVVSYSGPLVIIDTATSHTELTGIQTYIFNDGTVNEKDGNALVADLFYYSRYHDIWNAHIEADTHYSLSGWHEGRDPSAFFDTNLYLALNQDVLASGVNPLDQFHSIGWTQNRQPSGAFDIQKYLAAYPDVAAAHVDPLEHFLSNGIDEGRVPFPVTSIVNSVGFDALYYLQTYADVTAARVDPYQHFLTSGWHEGRNPNAYFDTRGYLATYTDVAAAGVNPLIHFDQYGWHEGRISSPAFDPAQYLAAYGDVAAAGVDPLKHFLEFGIDEGRMAFAKPVFDTNGAANTVLEGAAAGTNTGLSVSWGGWVSPNLSFSLSSDSSGGAFTINSLTGQVTIADASKLDFETSGPSHSHTIVVVAHDGALSSSQSFTIDIGDVIPTAPVDNNGAANAVAEGTAANTPVGITLFSNEPNGPMVSFSLTNDAGGRFFVDGSGVVRVANAALLDFETSGPSHQFTITAQTTSGAGSSATQDFTITVTDTPPSTPVDANGAPDTVAEGAANGTLVGIVASSTDLNGPAPTYSLTDDSSGRFTINPASGAVSVANGAAIDFETAPGHAYSITVLATVGALNSSQSFAIGVTDANDIAPVFTSSAAPSLAENTKSVVSLATTDADTVGTNPPVFSVSGGADAGLFQIAGDGHTLEFKIAPDFDVPGSAAASNVYAVEVSAFDGVNTAVQSLTVTVTDQNDIAPVFVSGATGTEPENSPTANVVYDANATDADGTSANNTIAYSLSTGGDNDLFNINASTGEVTFKVSPNFEADAGANNVYDIVVHANDGVNDTTRNVAITVTDVNDNAPVFSSSTTASFAENTATSTVAYDANATDADGTSANNTIAYSLSAGGDNDLFDINATTGEVTFKVSPNFEAPGDAGANNVYDIVVHANDGVTDVTRNVAITVTDVNDNAPAFSSGTTANFAENTAAATVAYDANATDPDGTSANNTIAYSLSTGGDNDLFNINASTGEVTFKVSPNFEAPADAGTNNIYDIVVHANDGVNDTTRNVAITVTDVNVAPSFSSGTTASVAEGFATSTVAYDANATDDGENSGTLTYSFGGGTDDGLFTIDSDDGEVRFSGSPNFELPGDNGANNVYDIIVRASDGTLQTDRAVAITVTNQAPSVPVDGNAAANEASNGAGAGSGTGIDANSTDPAGGTVTFSLTNNAGDRFAINSSNGVVTVSGITPIVFDGGGNNDYTITVRAEDPSGLFRTQDFTITVIPNTPPDLTVGGTLAYTENDAATLIDSTITITDPDDSNMESATVQITGNYVNGQDVLAFVNTAAITGSFDAGTGTLTLTGPDTLANYEAALESVTYVNNSNDPSTSARTVTFLVNDGAVNSNAATATINITARNDEPTLAAAADNPVFPENGVAVDLYDSVSASTVEAGQSLDQIVLTVTNVSGTTAEFLNIDGTPVELTDGNSETTATNGMTAAVAVAGGIATVTITGGITTAAMQTLVDGLSYGNTSEDPGSANRVVTITSLRDNGAGDDNINSTLSVVSTVTVTPINDEPTLTATGGTPTFTEDGAAADLYSSVTASTVESGQTFASLTLTVSNVTDGADEILSFDGSDVALTNGNSVATATNGLIVGVTLAGSMATVSFSGAALSVAQLQTLIDGITYRNSSQNPTDANRTITLIQVVDSGSNVNPNDNTATLSFAATVDVAPVNDAPAVTPGTGGAFTENGAAVDVAGSLTLTDVDSANLTQVTVTLDNAQANDVVSMQTVAGTSGELANGVDFSISGNVVTLTGGDNVAEYQSALQEVQFSNTSEAPSTVARSFTIAANDGAVVNNIGSANVNVTVTAVNDAPVNAGVPGSQQTAFSDTAFTVTGLSVSDVDAGSGDIVTTLSVNNGTITATAGGGAIIGANGTDNVTITGTVAQVNATLANNVTYLSDSGFTGQEVFTVLTSDQGNTGVDPGAGGTGTLTNEQDSDAFNIAVLPQVWFIDNDFTDPPSGPLGSQNNPFTSIAAFNGSGAPGPNDYVYLRAGTYTEADGINLQNGQTLIGQGENLEFADPFGGSTIVLETGSSGQTPVIVVTGDGGEGIQLASGNTIRGLDVGMNHVNAVGIEDGGGTVGTLTISNVGIGVGSSLGSAIDIDQGGTLNVILESVTSNGAARAIDLGTTAGLAGTGNNFTVSGATLINDATADGIVIGNSSLNTIFTGLVTIVNDVGAGTVADGVDLGTTGGGGANTGAYSFNGGVDITVNGNGAFGFRATSSGTVNIADPGGTTTQITSVNGTALLINPTAFNATLDSITSGGGANGVSLTGMTGSLTVNGAVTIDNSTGDGLVINGSAGNINFGSVSIDNVAGDGIDISGDNGNITISGGNVGAIGAADANGIAVDINGANGDNNTITINAAINDATAANDIIEVTGRSTGTVDFNGLITSTSGGGIDINTNTGGTVRFDGGMNLSTGAATALNSTGNTGMTLVVTDPGAGSNILTTTTGTALNVANTTIGAEGLTFQSISANGAANGIVLNTTGTNGLTVTGTDGVDGGTDPDAGTGGTIQNTTSHAVLLTNANNVSLGGLTINGTNGDGINMTGGTNLTLTTATISNIGDGDNDNAMTLVNVGGTVSIQNSAFNNVAEEFVESTSLNTNLTMNVNNSTFTQPNTLAGIRAAGAFAGNGILFTESGSSNLNLNVTNSTFTDIKLFGIQVGGTGSGVPNAWSGNNTNVTLDNNDFLVTITNALGNPNNRANAINIQGAGSVDIDASITNNLLDGGGGGGVQLGADGSSNVSATIDNNDITDQFADGILAAVDEAASMTLLINNNRISNTSSDGMEIANDIGDGVGEPAQDATLNVTITNNTVTNTNTNVGGNGFFAGIGVFGGSTPGDVTFVNITGNTVGGSPASSFDYAIDGSSFGDPITVQGPGSGPVAEADFLAAPPPQNISGSPAGQKTFIGNAFYSNGATVPTPVFTPLTAASGEGPGAATLTTAALAPIFLEAVHRWQEAGATPDQIALIDGLHVTIDDLADGVLAGTSGSSIVIDDDAAGWGWFVDSTPWDNLEFNAVHSETELAATGGEAAGHIDLLTAVMHELGHALGLEHSQEPGDLMDETVGLGVRRLSDAKDVADATAAGENLPGPMLVSPEPVNQEFIGQNIVRGFDAEYYLAQYADVAAAGIDPLLHFELYGWQEGRNPNAFFDTAGYLEHYADVAAAGINPLTHYDMYGWAEGRDPSASFDTAGYLATYADVAAAHVDPLDHFLRHGVHEGRSSVNDGLWGT